MEFDPGFLVVFVGSQLTTVALGTPFAGAMTRLRANYAPVGTKGAERGVLGTLKETWEVEGMWGIFKGAYATAFASLTVSTASAAMYVLVPTADPSTGIINSFLTRFNLSANAGVAASICASLALGIALIPFSVLTSRAVVTPYCLPFSSSAIRGLTSARERAEPWRLWTAPGMIANYVIQTLAPVALSTLTLPLLYGVAAASSPALQGQGGASPEYFGVAYVGLSVAAASYMVPLSVLAEKLAVASDADAAEEKAKAAEFERLASGEDVIRARPGPRYSGLLDALATVKREEGIAALYRGWVWTALSLATPAISQVMAAAQAGRGAQM